MMLMTNAPVELYDQVAIGPASTSHGEMLAHLDEVPAGAWLAVVLESIDRSTLTAMDLIAYQQAGPRLEAWGGGRRRAACARLAAWGAAQQPAAVAQFAACPHPDGAADVEVGFEFREPRGSAQCRI